MEDNADRSPRAERRPGITVGRVFGVPVYLNASWLLLAALVTLTYGQLVQRTLDLSPGAGYLVGFGFVVCLLVSVLLHELGHALTARRYGIGVRGITLELLGGYTEMDRDAPAPKVELLVSLAGPAVSLVLGAGAAGVTVAATGGTLLHELGHALTARRYGIGVRGITLELLGGYTEMDRDAPAPKVELLVSLAGPAVSLVLGAAAAGVTAAATGGTLLHQLALQLAVSNTVVAVFNALPGLPLDGGRALRAAVWAISHNRHLGTLVAGWSGRVVAVITGVGALTLYTTQVFSAFGMIFMVLVAVTLWQGATQAIRLAKISSRFPLIDLVRLARPVFVVPTGTPLAEAQRRAAETGPARAALAVADSAGRMIGLVQPAAADAVPVERRPWVAVDTVSRGLEGIRAIPSGLRGEEVIRAVQADPGSEYLVTTGQDIVGVLHVADLAQLLEPGGTGQ